MTQRLLDGDSLRWVESQQLLEQVKGQLVGLREKCLERNLLLEGQGSNVFTGTSRLDSIVVLHGGGSKDIEDEGQLVVVCPGCQSAVRANYRGNDLQSFPGNRGFPLSISAKMQPTLHTSMALVYSLNVSMISGARYQRVATYSVMKPELSSVDAAERARPKSQTFRSQFALRRRFEGFRSRWRTFAECKAFRARSVW